MIDGGAAQVYQTAERILDKWLFVIVALGGGVAIAGAKAVSDSENVGSWLPMVVAVVLMLLYFVCVKFTKRFRLREDQAGDNMYYLGFIYTLVSLSVALYEFRVEGKASEYIASSFGVALVTTIVGVTMRILLHQMREDPIDIEREVRAQLSETAGQLRAEMTHTLVDFNMFRRGLYQSIEEGFKEISSAAQSVLHKATDEYKVGTGEAIAGLRDSFDTFSVQSKKLNEVARRLVTALESLANRIDRVEAPTDMVERAIGPAVAKISEIAESLLALTARETERSSRVTETLQQIQIGATGLAGATKDAESALKRFSSDVLVTYERQVRDLATTMQALAEAGTGLANVQKHAISDAVVTGEEIVKMIRERSEALSTNEATLSRQFGETLQALAADHRELNRRIADEHANAAKDLMDELEHALTVARDQRAALSREVDAARRANEDLVVSLTSMARLMTDELRRPSATS